MKVENGKWSIEWDNTSDSIVINTHIQPNYLTPNHFTLSLSNASVEDLDKLNKLFLLAYAAKKQKGI